jgi:hypothetical protein
MKKKSEVFAVGASVQWKWMGRNIGGVVVEIHTEPIAKLIKGKSIKRNGSVENPAYYVQSVAGNFALKLQTELEAAGKEQQKRPRPSMFRS